MWIRDGQGRITPSLSTKTFRIPITPLLGGDNRILIHPNPSSSPQPIYQQEQNNTYPHYSSQIATILKIK